MPEHTDTARSAVLARLWGAFAREPLPGLTGRTTRAGELRVRLADGRELAGPADAAEPFATPARLVLTLDGCRYTDPVALLSAVDLGPHTARLATEVADSVANLALAHATAPVPDGQAPALRRYDLAGLEQCVRDGHPLHPLCRTRLGMSPDEVRAYAPEHRPLVRLPVYRVPERDWYTTGAPLPPRLVVHPWQAAHVLDRYPSLTPTGDALTARPLMSLRTLALAGDPRHHVKTAVDVQMTSAVRIVSPAAVRNGPAVSTLLARLGDRAGITVLREVAAAAVLVDGQPCRSLAMVYRQAPDPTATVLPLAALAAPSPASGRPLLTEAIRIGYQGRPEPFAADLVTLLLPPLLRLLHLGAALEAHGQNTLVQLRDGRPSRILYRDVGGVRLSPARLGRDTPPLHGDLASDDPEVLRTKLLAAVGVVLGELAATLTREYGTDPARIWRLAAVAARDTVRTLPGGYRDGAALSTALSTTLFGPTLPVKATTAMRLAADPLTDVWTTLPNPLAGES